MQHAILNLPISVLKYCRDDHTPDDYITFLSLPVGWCNSQKFSVPKATVRPTISQAELAHGYPRMQTAAVRKEIDSRINEITQ